MTDKFTASRREIFRFLAFVIVLAGLWASLGSPPSEAQDWPTRPVKVIVPYGPGGVTDLIARLVSDRLTKALGQPFVIENRGGAGGSIGTQNAARSPNDGYSLLFTGSPPITIIPQIQKIAYDPINDLAPIGIVTTNGMALTVHPSLPVHSIREFIEYVKAHPGKVNYVILGAGSSPQIGPALLSAREPLNMVAVPYQSVPPAMAALMTGTVQMFFSNISDVIEPVRSGKIRLLGISTTRRSSQFPDIPVINETVSGFNMIVWHGIFAPAGTPQAIISRLSNTLKAASQDAELVRVLSALGIDTASATPKDLAQIIKSDRSLYRSALGSLGLLRKE